ncbi:MAG: hypothetical protein ACI3V0_10315 [Faecousia sp.]
MKKTIIPLVIIFLVMFGCPWAAVTFAPGDAAMAICFVLFFGLNPLGSLYVGIWSGLAVKGRWYWPMVNAAAFLLSAWALFTPEEPAFGGYAIAYLAVGFLAMIVTVFVVRGIRRELEA